MSELAIALADRRFSNTAKALIILEFLGGKATTPEILSAGIEGGARPIRGWKVPTLLRSAKDRVADTPQGWLLLPSGREYLSRLGYQAPSASPPLNHLGNSVSGRPTIFLGHGRSPLWRELRDFLRDRVGVTVDEFNHVSVVGVSTEARLSQMLDNASVAIVLLTAEDERASGEIAARLNVVHETGLFQGRLGFQKVAILLEDPCVEFSNIAGIGQIRFPTGQITSAFEEVRHFLEREGIIRPA